MQLFKTAVGVNLLLDPADYFSILLARDGTFETPETDLISRLLRPGDTCVDAGCHVGYYTCLFAQLVGENGQVYAFDANLQACQLTERNLSLNRLTKVEVTHAALAEHAGSTLFYLSTKDQSGLGSLGRIANYQEILSVPCMRLEDFLKGRSVEHIRLLKIDVEGSEEIVLSGLGHLLTTHLADFILIELYDERLELMGSSTEKVGGILTRAGYEPWAYQSTTGWSRTDEVRSRGDCNYLFVSPTVHEPIPCFSLAGVVAKMQTTLSQMQTTLSETKDDLQLSKEEEHTLSQKIQRLEQEQQQLREENSRLKETLLAIQHSAGWRVLNAWRRLRNALAPEKSTRRALYDFFVNILRR